MKRTYSECYQRLLAAAFFFLEQSWTKDSGKQIQLLTRSSTQNHRVKIWVRVSIAILAFICMGALLLVGILFDERGIHEALIGSGIALFALAIVVTMLIICDIGIFKYGEQS